MRRYWYLPLIFAVVDHGESLWRSAYKGLLIGVTSVLLEWRVEEL